MTSTNLLVYKGIHIVVSNLNITPVGKNTLIVSTLQCETIPLVLI